jgi:hypothetical protein
MSSAQQNTCFTLAEANQRLPLVRAIVTDIVTLQRDLDERRARLERVQQVPGTSKRSEDSLHSQELKQIEEGLAADETRLTEYATELNQLGVELKDASVGLVDFRTRIENREAFLCWKLGEPEISFWHELNAGVEGRQSLMHDSLSTDDSANDAEN